MGLTGTLQVHEDNARRSDRGERSVVPKKQRPPEETEAVKNSILEEALKLIAEHGFEGFSMRKLGIRLGMAAKTVYNYFTNKDEIYLHVLTRGFEFLYEDLEKAYNEADDPAERLRGMARAFVAFGLEKSNYYDIMMTWYVPKYNDYVGTPLQPTAYRELMAALRSADLCIKVGEEIADTYGNVKREEARMNFIQLLTGLHGVIALYNNTILNYVHEDPAAILDRLTDNVLSSYMPPGMTVKPD